LKKGTIQNMNKVITDMQLAHFANPIILFVNQEGKTLELF